MKNLIIPAAGLSSRFPNMKPKWLLTHPNGNMMFIQSVSGLNLKEFDNIYLFSLTSTLDKYSKIRDGIKRNFFENFNRNIEIVELDKQTNSQSQTVYEGIKKSKLNGSILIKDSDNYFECSNFEKNSICYSSIEDTNIRNIQNKSYLTFDSQKKLLNIVEKRVIGSHFSVGGYYFSDQNIFLKTYEKIRHLEGMSEVYISNIVNELILNDAEFNCKQVSSYKDWGTLEDWEIYKSNYKTFFIDIDGVLLKNGSDYFDLNWADTPVLEKNVNYINNLNKKYNCQIILTTARKESYREKTIEQLKKINLKFDHIIFNLYHSKRIIINDFSNTNKYPTCEAINLERDKDNLEDYL
jgi:hypothetical protein